MLFCKDYREQVAAEVGSAAPNVVSKALGEKWGQTTDRHTWEKQAEKDKARYDKEMAAHTAMLDEEAAEVRRERDAYAAGPSDREAERSQKRQQMQEETAKREVRGRSNPGGEGGAEGCGGACGRGGGGGGREGEKAAARPVPSATFLAPRGPHPTLASPLDESNRDVPRTSTMHLPCIYHERAIHAFCMRVHVHVHVHVPRLRLCMHVQAEPKKEKKQRTATAAEKSLAQQNKEVLADSGSQVSRLPEGRGEARAGVGRGRGEPWRRAEACSCPASGGRAGAGGEEGATGGRAPPPPRRARASSSARAVRAGSSARAWARLRGALARRACEARPVPTARPASACGRPRSASPSCWARASSSSTLASRT